MWWMPFSCHRAEHWFGVPGPSLPRACGAAGSGFSGLREVVEPVSSVMIMRSTFCSHLTAAMLRSFLSVVMLMSAAVCMSQSTDYGRIQGVVLDTAYGDPIPYVTVQVSGSQRAWSSDVDGVFVLEPLQEGRYDLVMMASGYRTDTVRNVLVESAKTSSLRVHMREHREEVYPPGPICESESGWHRFWRRLRGRPRRVIGPG